MTEDDGEEFDGDHYTIHPPPGELYFCPTCKSPLVGVELCLVHDEAHVIDCGCEIDPDTLSKLIKDGSQNG